MRRRVPVLAATVAMLGALGGTAHAQAPTQLARVTGDVQAIAVSGNAIIVARAESGELFIERRVPGAAPQVLFHARASYEDDSNVRLAASSSSLAVSFTQPGSGGDFESSHVLVGPVTGPLREVASCQHGFTPAPVAALGTQLAWADGGCGEPSARPVAVGPQVAAFGDADPSVAVRRIAVPEDQLLGSIVPTGAQTGLLGIIRPQFLSSAAGEVRPYGAAGLGDAVRRRPGEIALPLGAPDGLTPLISTTDGAFDDEDGDSGDTQDRTGTCSTSVLPLPAANGADAPLDLGGCVRDDEGVQPSASVAADRLVALVRQRGHAKDKGRFDRLSVTSIRGDGTDRRSVVSGTYRGPKAVGADASRVVWAQAHCAGDSDIVGAPLVGSPGGTALGSCTVQARNQRPAVRNGRFPVSFSCPNGCEGSIVDDTSCATRADWRFGFEAGRHTVRLRLPKRIRRRTRLLLRFSPANGPQRTVVVHLRRPHRTARALSRKPADVLGQFAHE